jgi:tetratricopeptide (TPR) repeat protein
MTNPQVSFGDSPFRARLKSCDSRWTLLAMRNPPLLQRFSSLFVLLALCTPLSLASEFQDPPSSASNPRADAAAAFARGQQALQSGDLATADASFRKVLSIDPQAGPAYANLGVIAMRRQEWDRALTLLEKAEKLDPTLAGIRLNIGLVKYRREDYTGAISPLESVLRDQPNSTQARYLLGLCQLYTERYSDALAILEPLWPTSSSDIMYLYALSIAAHRSNQKELDERAMSRLVEIGSDTPEFHLILGKAYLNRGETDQAIAQLQKAEAANPDLPYVHFGLGIAYTKSDNNEQAESELKKEISLEPNLPDAYEQLGEFYLKMSRYDDAEKTLRQALHLNPKMPASLFGLAKINMQREKYQQALAEIDAALRLAPGSQTVHFVRGRILLKLGRREEAEKELVTAKNMLDAAAAKETFEPSSMDDNRVRNPELSGSAPQ